MRGTGGRDRCTISFLTRAGNITLNRLAEISDQPLRDALSDHHGAALTELPPDPVGWLLDQPATLHGHTYPSRVVSAPAAVAASTGPTPTRGAKPPKGNRPRGSRRRTRLRTLRPRPAHPMNAPATGTVCWRLDRDCCLCPPWIPGDEGLIIAS